MKKLEEFVIPFRGLKIGSHQFDFQIKNDFFENFEFSEYKEGDVKVTLRLEKEETMLILGFQFEGHLIVKCSRCLQEFPLQLDEGHQLIVKIGGDRTTETDDIVVITEDDELNVAQFIYETMSLAVPFQVVHPDDENGDSTCEPEMLALLDSYQKTETVDPRWEALKKLKEKN